MKILKSVILAVLLSFVSVTNVHAIRKVSILPLTIDVKSTETSIAGTAEAVPNTAMVGRETITIYNADHSSETIHCGDSDVTTSTGIPLDGTTPAITIDVDDSVPVYCISDGTAVSVRTLEVK